ncbi:MAG TPA: VWA domain-containing protein, partial [Gammaproteobacteria bacterium]|nr:VWA domain-containing protein [Gammaproteobacteria bacterium]
FVLDLSRSMDATDILPSRASRAKLKLIDLLNASDEGQVALVVYAAEAHVVSPLTDDAATIVAMIPGLSPDIMPAQGSRADRAITKAAQLLMQAGNHDGEIVLITDGVSGTKAIDAAEKAAQSGYTLHVVGVGTVAGSPLPARNGGFLKDASGAIVIPKLDRKKLKQTALAGSGAYVDLAVDDSDIKALVKKKLHADVVSENPLIREADLWQDEGHWFLLLAIPFAALGFRRGWLTMLVFSVCYLPGNDLYAFEWHDLWQTKDQQASTLLSAGEAEEAAAMFQNNNWKGAAYYKSGNYEQAAEAFSQSSSVEATYNRANALAKQGKLEQAIEAYDEVLAEKPEHADARFNKNLVEDALKNQKQKPAGDEPQTDNKTDQQQNSDSKQQQTNASQSQDQENQQPSSLDQSQTEPNQPQSEEAQSDTPQNQQSTDAEKEGKDEQEKIARQGDEGKKQEQEQEQEEQKKRQQQKALSEEERANLEKAQQEQKEMKQATQQWLRRIPDDPGGLLREKFLRQYQRQRNKQQTENPW